MKISLVTDEVSADLETALELAQSWGVDAVELRGIGQHRYPDVSAFWRARVPTLIKEFGLPVAAISPGLFKIPYPEPQPASTHILRWEDKMFFERIREGEALVRYHLEELLPMTIAAAKEVGAAMIVCFSFDRGKHVPATAPVPQAVVDVLADAARMVAAAGLTLAVEAEHICWGDNGARTAALVRRIGNPALGVNWDPANAYVAGSDRPYPEGYTAVRDLVRHVHYKDAGIDPQSGKRAFVFDGVVDWAGQIAALQEDSYDGYISIETHVRPKLEAARRSIERVRAMMETP